MTEPLTLPVTPRSSPGSRRFVPRRLGPFPHTTHQPPWLSRPEATSTDGSLPPHPLLALRARLPGRHCCLGFAALAQLPNTRSPTWLRTRSRRLAGYSPERQGHVSSIDFCNCMDSQARPRSAETPPFERDGKPPHGGWCRSCETPPAELLQPRGCSPHGEAHNAHRDVRTVTLDLPQPVLPQTPLVAHQHPPPSGTDYDGRPHGSSLPAGAELGLSQRQGQVPDALTGELVRRACDAETSRALKGRLLPTLAKASTVSRTQGAFHPRGHRLLSRDAGKGPPSLGCPLLVEPPRHLCYH